MTALCSSSDLESFAFCFFSGGIHDSRTGSVHADGFLSEDVFTSSNGGFETGRAEAGRCGEDDVIHAGHFECLHVAVKSAETFVRWHAEHSLRFVGGFWENIRHGYDLGVHSGNFRSFQKVSARTRTTSTHTDDDGVEGLLVLRVKDVWKTRNRRR